MRILIIGQCSLHWGRMEFGNIGNYYILEPFIRELHSTFPGAEIFTTFQLSESFCQREKVKVLPMELYYGWSGQDLELAKKELKLAQKYSNEGVLSETTDYINEVQKSDLVIDFSGDIWGDNANFLGKDRFIVGLCKDRVAQLLNKKTAMLAGSPGPFGDMQTREFAKEVFENFDLVTNREPVSTELLSKEGFNTLKTQTLACPAFLFEPTKDKQKTLDQLKEEGINLDDKPTIGFIVCGWNFLQGPFDKWPRDDEDYQVFAETIEYIINELDAQVVLMSHSNGFDIPPASFKLKHGRDYPIIKQLQEIVRKRKKVDAEKVLSIDGIYSTWDTKAIIGRFDMLVSGRIHAAVAGFSQHVPTVVIDYGHEPKAHKLRGFAQVAEMEHLVADPAKSDDLVNKIKSCWQHNKDISQKLSENIPNVQKKAKENFKLLKDI